MQGRLLVGGDVAPRPSTTGMLTSRRTSRSRRDSRKVPARSLRYRDCRLHKLYRKRVPLPSLSRTPHRIHKSRVLEAHRLNHTQAGRRIPACALSQRRCHSTHGGLGREIPRRARQHRWHSNLRNKKLPHRAWRAML